MASGDVFLALFANTRKDTDASEPCSQSWLPIAGGVAPSSWVPTWHVTDLLELQRDLLELKRDLLELKRDLQHFNARFEHA